MPFINSPHHRLLLLLHQHLPTYFDDIDTDHDGFINLSEFAALCRTSSDAATAAHELREAFNLYDQDKNGLISTSELHQVLIQLGMKSSEQDCARMIQSVDADGDGSVNFEEFLKMMSASTNTVNGSAQ